MLTKDQTDYLTSTVQDKVMQGIVEPTRLNSATEHLVVPKKVIRSERSKQQHYNDWPNTQGVSHQYEFFRGGH